MQILADHAAIAMENAALYRQAQIAAVTDDLTGLGNSRHLNQLLPQLIAEGRPLALLVLDFDNFKQVVDRYGHLIGSQTLAYLGRLMARLLRPGDFAARFGGDEFADHPARQRRRGRRRDGRSAARHGRGGRPSRRHAMSTSPASPPASASRPSPTTPPKPNALLRAADQAMYAVKRAQKNGVGRRRLAAVSGREVRDQLTIDRSLD